MKTVKVRDLILGEGRPKICIPIVGKTKEAIVNEVRNLEELDNDLLEIRIDHFEEVEDDDKVLDLLASIRMEYSKPILFTFRSKNEGGVYELSPEKYLHLNKIAIESKQIDLIDVELFVDEIIAKNIIDLAKQNDVKLVMSNHNFDKTVSKEEIISRLRKMQELNADITKIAQMPKTEEDVLKLLSATLEMKNKYGDRPCITMSMGRLGKVSRVSGELFGSAMTFGIAGEPSAPGQIAVDELSKTLDVLKI